MDYMVMDVETYIDAALTRPRDFGSSHDELFDTWGISHAAVSRDADTIDRSNWDATIKALQEFEGPFSPCDTVAGQVADWDIMHAGHWAVGWVDQIIFRVRNADGSPSAVAIALFELHDALQQYPILDDEAHSMLEYEELTSYVKQEVGVGHVLNVFELVLDDLLSNSAGSRVDDIDEDFLQELKREYHALDDGLYALSQPIEV